MLLQVKKERAFTLIELISVIVLLSILGIFAFSRLGNIGGFASRAFYDEVVNAVRYAQKLAVSTGCEVRVNLSATGYDLHQRVTDCTNLANAFTLDVMNPANRSAAYANSNADASISPTPSLTFTAQSTVAGITDSQVISVNGRSFTVFEHTGLIDAQ